LAEQRYKILFIQYVKEHLILTFYTTSGKEGWLKAGVVGAPICFNNRLMYSPTTSPYGDSSFPKEESIGYYRL
ncbi:hypothetical protein, partial [Bacteroides caccae]|uniref:hypothetical protein n=3 Tax=Bacteroides caccae TaxID=47678 RepID=UPI0032EAFB32